MVDAKKKSTFFTIINTTCNCVNYCEKLLCGSFGTLYKGVGDNGSFFVMKEVSLFDEGKLLSMLGQIACGLLNHYFLEFTKGIMFAYEIKVTTGQ